MTTMTPQAQAPVVLGTSATTLFTVPASNVLLNARAKFVNTSAAIRTITVYAVPSAGAAGDSNTLLKAASIAIGDEYDLEVGNLPAGSVLSALADAATSVTAHLLSGTLRQP